MRHVDRVKQEVQVKVIRETSSREEDTKPHLWGAMGSNRKSRDRSNVTGSDVTVSDPDRK